MTLIDVIRDCVPVLDKPAVNISGGIDSTIVLHHLREKFDGKIRTYTLGFPQTEGEFEYAKKVAKHYDTIHTEVLVDNLLDVIPALLKHFPVPRYNLWMWFLAEKQRKDGIKNCYIGEGGDEHFGGYWYKPDKSYVELWGNYFEYIVSSYQRVYAISGVNLIVPLHPNNLDIKQTLPYYDYTQQKTHLKNAYEGVLPKFVLDRPKRNGRFSYWVIWNSELKQHFPTFTPQNEDQIRNLLQCWATDQWLKINKSKLCKPFCYKDHEEPRGLETPFKYGDSS